MRRKFEQRDDKIEQILLYLWQKLTGRCLGFNELLHFFFWFGSEQMNDKDQTTQLLSDFRDLQTLKRLSLQLHPTSDVIRSKQVTDVIYVKIKYALILKLLFCSFFSTSTHTHTHTHTHSHTTHERAMEARCCRRESPPTRAGGRRRRAAP